MPLQEQEKISGNKANNICSIFLIKICYMVYIGFCPRVLSSTYKEHPLLTMLETVVEILKVLHTSVSNTSICKKKEVNNCAGKKSKSH